MLRYLILFCEAIENYKYYIRSFVKYHLMIPLLRDGKYSMTNQTTRSCGANDFLESFSARGLVDKNPKNCQA